MSKTKKQISLRSAVGIGVGSMIGAGIFALMGQAGSIAGKAVYISFILGALVASVSGYSIAKLGAKFPAAGGIVEYVVQSFGVNIFTGGVSIMLYISKIIALALLSKAFGSYAAALMDMKNNILYVNLFSFSVLFGLGFIHYFGIKKVVKFENASTLITVIILLIFAVVGLLYMNPDLMAPTQYPTGDKILFSIAITFFAFQGFSIIAHTAENIPRPEKTLPKAIFISIAITMVIYTSLAVAVFGNLGVDEVAKAKDYALAEAAQPVFGMLGFTIISITALFSTSSSINAVLYSAVNITYQMAKNGELPGFFAKPLGNSREGLLISLILTGVLILFLNLLQIAAVGSITVLFIHAITHLGHLRVLKATKASGFLVTTALIVTLGLTVMFLIYSSQESFTILILSLGIFAVSMLIEFLIRVITRRKVEKHSKKKIDKGFFKTA